MAKKYQAVVSYRSTSFNLTELPQTEVPVTLNFDRTKVVGTAKLRFDENMNVVADIEVENDDMVSEIMKSSNSNPFNFSINP